MWCKADYTDVSELVEMFWENISSAPEYISHGEIQMGMAKGPGELEDEDVYQCRNRSRPYDSVNPSVDGVVE